MQYPNGQIYIKKQGNKTFYFYPDGTLKTEMEIEDGHRTVRLYWPSGKVKRQTVFNLGSKEKDEYFPP